MKHIFTIHSPLTFLVAYAVIEHLDLERNDVVLLSTKYKVPISDFKVAPSFAEKFGGTLWQRLRYFNVPVYYDRYINSLTEGQAFIAYVDLMSYMQKILVTNQNCMNFHFIEEGNSAYQAIDDLTDVTWAERSLKYRNIGVFGKEGRLSIYRVLRGFNVRLLSVPYLYSAFVNFKDIRFFSFSENAFYNAPAHKKIYVKPRVNAPEILQLAANVKLENEVIWLDGSNARYTGLDENYYYEAIVMAIDLLKKQGILKDRLYLKLRPGIKDYSENYLYQAVVRAGLEVHVLPNDMILECLFMTSKNCHVIGVLTAALEYAYVFGHQAISIYSLFREQPQTFFNRMNGFWKHIRRL